MANVDKTRLLVTTIEDLNEKDRARTVLSKTRLQLLYSLLVLVLFAVVLVLAGTGAVAQDRSNKGQHLNGLLKLDASWILFVLRASQGLMTTVTTITIDQCFCYIQWISTTHVNGISYHQLLALTPTTGLFSTVMLAIAKVSLHTRLWAILRVSFTGIVALSGLVLFFRTSNIVVYETESTYNVTAGVGPFNGSYVQPFFEYLHSLSPDYPFQTLPHAYYAASYNLVINPIFSTVAKPQGCKQNHTSGSRCMSYLLSGGLEMVAPFTVSTAEDYPMVRITKVPTMQLDFAQDVRSNMFSDEDCDTFGATNTFIAMRLCLAADPTSRNRLNTGLYLCNSAENSTSCDTPVNGSMPNMTSSLAFYKRQATVTVVRANYSITEVSDLTDAMPVIDTDVVAYKSALGWLLNFTAAGIPPPSSIVASFWGADDQLNGGPATYGLLLQEFQSILAFPLWLFNANNFGNIELKKRTTSSAPPETGLPAEFFTSASIVGPYLKLKFDPVMVVLFAILQGMTILFAWTVLSWLWFVADIGKLPELSSYPYFDAMFKIEARTISGLQPQRVFVNAGGEEAVRLIDNVRVYMKED